MALQLGLEDRKLPQTIGELRVFVSNAGCADRRIEAAEDLLECVAVAFRMAAGQIGVATRLGLEQRRIFEDDLVAGVAVAYPEFVGPFLVPCGRGLWCRKPRCCSRFLRPAETWLATTVPRVRVPMRKITAPKSSVSTGVSM